MKPTRNILILLAVLGAASAARAQQASNNFAPVPRPPPGVQALQDLEYGRADGKPRLLDLYLPEKRERPLPLIIWIHGGAWMAGSKNNPSPALPLTREGFAVAHVGYRFSQEAQYPAQIHDCKAAVRWLRANSKKYNLDPDKFAAWGASAGGHLVALLGTSCGAAELEGTVNGLKESSCVQAVVDWFGPTDFLQIGKFESDIRHNDADSPESRLIGGAILQNPDKVAKANPITYVSKTAPPFLIMHGDQDRTVPFNQSELLVAALQKAGVAVTFVPMKGAGHGFGGPQAVTPVREFLLKQFK